MEISFNENKSLCATCPTVCCKRMGCALSPEDLTGKGISITRANLIRFIESGRWSIDWWEGDIVTGGEYDRIYYLRARHVNAPIVDPSWGGICASLTPSGCSLSWEDRPKEGRAVIPSPNYKCTSTYGKRDYVMEWRQYQSVLEEVYDHFS